MCTKKENSAGTALQRKSATENIWILKPFPNSPLLALQHLLLFLPQQTQRSNLQVMRLCCWWLWDVTGYRTQAVTFLIIWNKLFDILKESLFVAPVWMLFSPNPQKQCSGTPYSEVTHLIRRESPLVMWHWAWRGCDSSCLSKEQQGMSWELTSHPSSSSQKQMGAKRGSRENARTGVK